MAAIFLLAALALGPNGADSSSTAGAPTYSADSIANSAAGVAGYYAPNTFISIYGQNLSRVTRAINANDVNAGMLPTTLAGTGVRVLINQIPADVWYVSPTLVNVLVPMILVAGPAVVALEADGIAGPQIAITLGTTAPALFQADATTVLAVHLDASLVAGNAPAHGGESDCAVRDGAGTDAAGAGPQPDRAGSGADFGAKRFSAPVEWNGGGCGAHPLCRRGAGVCRIVSNQSAAAG